MPEIMITVNERPYTMKCEEGQQAHIKFLAQTIDQHIQTLVDSFGQVGDQRLLIMTALDLADELVKQKEQRENNPKKTMGSPREAIPEKHARKVREENRKEQKKLIEKLKGMSVRLEKLADSLLPETDA